jgi:hypothetical protein
MAISKIGSKALVDCSVAAVDIADNSITAAKLAGSIANAKLANSSIIVNGTTVALGASGSIPAVQWQAVITADGSTATSATAGEGYFIDTTSNAHTINLPGSPSAGDTIAIKDYAGTFATNNLTIGRNGNNIQGVANNSLIDTNRASLTLVYVDATKGWLYAVESNVAFLGPTFISATGGTVTESGDFKIHTFTGDGCFVVSSAGNSLGSTTVEYLVVAGGGGGASRSGAGGGGAGGLRTCTSFAIGAVPYPIVVGGGGAESCSNILPYGGGLGTNSNFSTITSAGGGGGKLTTNPFADGGSGGGGGRLSAPAGAGNTPPVSPPQGNPGGIQSGGAGGGGGGASASGSTGTTSGGAGGAGTTSIISGSPVTYAGGGGGSGGCSPGTNPGGSGGPGGGGAGATIISAAGGNGTAGTVNTGGGGGGAGGTAPAKGAAGGSGIVVIRYKFQ